MIGPATRSVQRTAANCRRYSASLAVTSKRDAPGVEDKVPGLQAGATFVNGVTQVDGVGPLAGGMFVKDNLPAGTLYVARASYLYLGGSA